MGEIRDNITRSITENRKRLGLSQKELAEKLGVKNTSVSSWERGANAPDIEIIFELCKIFGIPISEMYGCDTSSNSSDIKLNGLELELIRTYRRLNNDGKEELRKRSIELISLGYEEKGDMERMA